MITAYEDGTSELDDAGLLTRASELGRVRISDGDFEYAFEVEKRLYVLKHPDSFPHIPPRLITYLNADETSVAMHRWRRRPLEMRVTKNGKPVVGQVLLGRLAVRAVHVMAQLDSGIRQKPPRQKPIRTGESTERIFTRRNGKRYSLWATRENKFGKQTPQNGREMELST